MAVAVAEVAAAAVVLVAVAVEVAAVASFDPASWAPRPDRGGLTPEEPRASWRCCPPSRFGGMGSLRAAAWQPLTQEGPSKRVFLLLNPVKSQGSRRGPLLLTDAARGSRLRLYSFHSQGKHLSFVRSFVLSFCFSERHPLTLHLKPRSLKKLRANPGKFPPTSQSPNGCARGLKCCWGRLAPRAPQSRQVAALATPWLWPLPGHQNGGHRARSDTEE